ncbi:MAG: FAD-dependent oxidoreductase [Chloroflexi bacterium]|nr:FAD-dependent oxidoreductase [Chloroflexota bacterium]
MATGKTIVVLGGGVGGLTTARALRKALQGEHRIVVVDRSPRHFFAPSYLWLMLGWRQPSQVSRDLARLLGSGIEFNQGQVEGIDTRAGSVTVSGKAIGYDYLVAALGAELAYDAVPNLFPAAYSYFEVEEALRLRDALPQFQGGRVVVLIPSLPYKCPAAPYEGALLLDYYLRKHGLRGRSEVEIFTPEPQPLPVAGPEVGKLVQELLGERGVGFHSGHRLSRIDPERRELAFENGSASGYDLLVAIPPHRCPGPVREGGLADSRGWVPVDKASLRATAAEHVYALGDLTVIPLPVGLPLPKAGVFAHGQGKVVARNIAAEITGRPPGAFLGEGS